MGQQRRWGHQEDRAKSGLQSKDLPQGLAASGPLWDDHSQACPGGKRRHRPLTCLAGTGARCGAPPGRAWSAHTPGGEQSLLCWAGQHCHVSFFQPVANPGTSCLVPSFRPGSCSLGPRRGFLPDHPRPRCPTFGLPHAHHHKTLAGASSAGSCSQEQPYTASPPPPSQTRSHPPRGFSCSSMDNATGH